MKPEHITVFGSGVLGAQIAFQTAFHGYAVVIYDLSDDLLAKAREKFDQYGKIYQQDMHASEADIEATLSRITYTTDLAQSVADADLTIEAIPESIQIKKDFYTKLGKLAPEKTIFCTNSSTLLPSQFAAETGRPAKFLALHFANQIWKYNTAEIMGHPETDPAVVETVVDFAKSIGMVPILVKKETPGYVLNSMLTPFLNAGMQLWIKGIADPQTIDKTWMLGTGSPIGPMAFYDIIGITTPYNIYKLQAEHGKEEDQAVVDKLKTEFIDSNKLSLSTGEGFYTYPNPAYQQPDFLKAPAAAPSKVTVKKVVVAGSGVLGYQIAVQTAFHGFDVTVYDINDEVVNKAKGKFSALADAYKHDLNATQQQIDAAAARLSYSSDLAVALKEADLLIEAVPETLAIKQDFWGKASKVAPAKTIFASNSSTLLPSQLAPFTNRPEQFINLHFANHIHIHNTAEVMGHPGTDPTVHDQLVEFANSIGMVPIELHKEQSGYVLDSLLIPLLIAGMGLWANGVADPATIDKTWMIATGALFGPMAILDKNGMNTNYNVVKAIPGELTQHIAEKIKTELIDKGKLGEVSGEGFYTYPNPAYEQKDFLT